MAEPKIRFKQDDGKPFPEWTKNRLEKFIHQVLIKNKDNNIYPVYSVNNQKGFIPQNEQFEEREVASDNKSNYKIVSYHQFAYNPSRINVGSIAYLKEKIKVIVSPLYVVFECLSGLNVDYLNMYIRTNSFNNKRRINTEGSVRDSLSYDRFANIETFFPSYEEQQKIADFLSSVDDVIAISEQEVANLETQKKAVMKKIFSQEVRFKKDDGSDFPAWKEYPLSYYLEIRDEKQVPTVEAPLMAFIAYNGVADKGDRYDRSFLVKTDDKKYKRTEYNDFIYSSNNLDVGSIGLNKYGSAVISVVYEIFKVKNTAIPECINEIIQAPANMAKILRYRQGALYGQYKIHAMNFLNVFVSAPCLEEQRLIADFLSNFDEAILLAKKELELWKELKKGLLQQMFV